MKFIKFVVKVNRGSRATEYVQQVNPTVHMTTNPKLALQMGRFTAEDVIESIRTSLRIPELVSVPIS